MAGTILTAQVDDDFVSDSYGVSYLILALSGSNNDAIITSLTTELTRYILSDGSVQIPMGVSLIGKIRANAVTVFGGLGIDRDVEYLAIAALAMQKGCVGSGPYDCSDS